MSEVLTAVNEGLMEIGLASDVPFMEGRSVVVDGERIASFSLPGGFAAIGGSCPHSGGPLADGIVSESCVTCPLHNWRVDLRSGEVVAGGEGAVEVYEVLEHNGRLFLRRPATSRAAA